MLADGSLFEFALNEDITGDDFVSPQAVLRLTVVPEPSGATLIIAVIPIGELGGLPRTCCA